MSFPKPFFSCVVFFSFLFFQIALGETQSGPLTERKTISGLFKNPQEGKVKIAFFDADSTLRVAPSGAPSANFGTDVAILPFLARPLIDLEKKGFLIAIVSNQAGIEKGYVTLKSANDALAYTVEQLARQKIRIHYYDFAEKEDENRKPGIGMAKELSERIKEKFGKEVDWDNSIMVGDSAWKKGSDLEPDGRQGEDFSNTDRLFAENLVNSFGAVKFFHPRDFFHWVDYGIRNFSNYKSLQEFLKNHPELLK